jgi:hypothetical protein
MHTSQLAELAWRKSSHSSSNGTCVEVAPAMEGMATRDSKNPSGPVLTFGTEEWAAFIAGVADGRFSR